MKSHSIIIITLFTFIYCQPTYSQSQTPEPLPIDIEYIDFLPEIDGILDAKLSQLKKYEFKHFFTFDNPINNDINVTYSLAYNSTHLYLYLETNTNEIKYNKRGYLYGDGYKVILGKLNPHAPSDEYYDLYYSPSKVMDQWDRGTIGTYNFQHISKPLSNLSESNANAHESTTGFEALIAWQDIHPINPFFMEDIGLNIYFAKYIGPENTHGYSLMQDESIWDEEVPKRNLTPVKFQLPKIELLASQIYRKNYQSIDDINIKVANNTINSLIEVKLTNQEPSVSLSKQIKLTNNGDWTVLQQPIEFSPLENKLDPGDYTLTVLADGQLHDQAIISILPDFDFERMQQTIKNHTNSINKNAVSTLLFKINKLQYMPGKLKIYETAAAINTYHAALESEINLFEAGKDPYKKLVGPYRRAFQSKIDHTYQPYSIKLPENYDTNKAYPLLVFLHGSGRDEQGLLNKPRGNGKFIELAPLGRDLFKAYAMQEAQIDIKEAIDDVIDKFNIDTNKIIIGGFSMGGYGALRSYYEYPNLFKGVAVFAGHPDLANAWGVNGKHPNFLDQQFAKKLKSVPVFIYHGTSDEAIQFNLAVQLKDALIAAGAIVTHSFVKGRGHRYQDQQTNDLYHQWLSQF